tara:strand:- start:1435 stop:2130 length:696 start_codon:yes stop_codon:yes gene_type:complete
MTNQNLKTVDEKNLDLKLMQFEFYQRKAKLYAQSSIIPKEFQNHIPHCFMVCEMAGLMNVPEMICFQHAYIIHGKISWSAIFMIAIFNASGRFTPITYSYSGQGDDRECVASSTIRETGEVVSGIPVSLAVAKKAGWYTKSGSKWKEIPELMMRYRAASYLIKTVAPDLVVGTAEENENRDIPDPKVITLVQPKKDVEGIALGKAIEVLSESMNEVEDPSKETVAQSEDLF